MAEKKLNWQLMSVYQIAQLLIKLENEGKSIAFRVQKHYYKSTNNDVMYNRLEEAEAVAKEIKAVYKQKLESI